jgi:hypothetical protein
MIRPCSGSTKPNPVPVPTNHSPSHGTGGSFATHVGRSSAVVINPCRLEGQELGVFVARCIAGFVDVVLEVLREDTLPGVRS